MTGRGLSATWNGRNRREVIRFLGAHWMGFSGAFPEHGEPDLRTVEFRDKGDVVSARVGQKIVRGCTGRLRVEEGPTHAS